MPGWLPVCTIYLYMYIYTHMYVCIHVTVYAIYHVSVPSNPKILRTHVWGFHWQKVLVTRRGYLTLWNCTQIILLLNPMSLVRDLKTLAPSNAMLWNVGSESFDSETWCLLCVSWKYTVTKVILLPLLHLPRDTINYTGFTRAMTWCTSQSGPVANRWFTKKSGPTWNGFWKITASPAFEARGLALQLAVSPKYWPHLASFG